MVYSIINEEPSYTYYRSTQGTQNTVIIHLIKSLLKKDPEQRPNIAQIIEMDLIQQTIGTLKKKYRVYEKLDIQEKLKSMDFNQQIVSVPKTADKGAISFADFLNQNDE